MGKIVVEKLCKAFGEQSVLKDFSYIFEADKVYCIMGKSGVGKTTLLNMMLGLVKADSGKIDGLSNKKISCVFQEDRLVENISAKMNVKLTTKTSDDEISKAFLEVGLDIEPDKPVSECSGGQKRRVAIVRALLADFDVLLLDEPFKGLDEESLSKTAAFIKAKSKEKFVIMVTHSVAEAMLFNAHEIHI